ncbi:hypothetical protein RJ640_022033 [Escallonia rubra]|uniref:Cellulose synthase-like protein G2 n=1 Tax=Escallonia rubra TaxID=112253 RepID=A0AA88U8T7_9ASTE|nr:hypothetical protein RJ640_022033 [Escallonia rubra]
MDDTLPLHLCHVQKFFLIINRSHTLFHSVSLMFLVYYRASFVLRTIKARDAPILPYVFVFASELLLSYIWLLNQAYRWRPVSRTVFPERLPQDEKLPALDVFVCTADPIKEPTLEVMNTVLSAMALEYPPEKLYVYLSDDGGCSATLHAMQEAWKFAKWWLPFCRRYGIKTRCPETYFSAAEDDYGDCKSIPEFVADKQKVKKRYEVFTELVTRIREKESVIPTGDHSPAVKWQLCNLLDLEVAYTRLCHITPIAFHIKVIDDDSVGDQTEMPLLLYVSLLDCDMYCNDPKSARQAMCFHLDSKMSPSLAFVQFPQKFYNISKDDIYDSQLRSTFKILWPGFDGLKGPCLSGSCFFIKKDALYHASIQGEHSFRLSEDFIKSLGQKDKANVTSLRDSSSKVLQETLLLASCAYENQTKWGEEASFRFFPVVEDYFTGFKLHCKGWTSVYFDPPRPSFLGSGTSNLNDFLVQGTRWACGLVEVGISRFCPLIYGSLRCQFCRACATGKLHSFLCTFAPVVLSYHSTALSCEWHFLVSNSYFMLFSLMFISSQSKHIQEVLLTGGSIQTWRNEQRVWMMKSVTSHLYGSLDAIMERLGMKEPSFLLTNKIVDDEQVERYHMGKFDYQTSTMLLVPLFTLVNLNVASLIWGFAKAYYAGSCNTMFFQVFLSAFIVTLNYPIIEGVVLRTDNGRVPPSITLLSAVLSVAFLRNVVQHILIDRMPSKLKETNKIRIMV